MITSTAPTQAPPTEVQLAEWAYSMKRSMLRQMLAVVSRPGILSFAGGLPAPELFPTEDYSEAVAHVLATDPKALQYGPPFPPLKAHIARLMAERGIACHQDQVFLTTGAQQALSIIAALLLDRGGSVMLEQLVYTGIQQVVAPYQAEILTVPTDLALGINIEAVERHLLGGARPAFLYVIPEAHNPLGVSIGLERRSQLLSLVQRFGVPVVEDDPYGFLCYDAPAIAPLRVEDDQWVFYVGSFSKILAPALRLGWMIVPEALVPKLKVVKEAFDLESSALIQRTVSVYLDRGHLPAHLERVRSAYRQRRDAMLGALERHFPAAARWTKPAGGMFIWVEFEGQVDVGSLMWRAVEEEQVAFVPGSAFRVDAAPMGDQICRADHSLRLNFTNSTPDQIEQGIERLGRLFKRHC